MRDAKAKAIWLATSYLIAHIYSMHILLPALE